VVVVVVVVVVEEEVVAAAEEPAVAMISRVQYTPTLCRRCNVATHR